MSKAKLATLVPENKIYTYDLLDDDRYLLAQVDGQKVLFDTGCPYSFKMPFGPDALYIIDQSIQLKHLPLSRAFLNDGFDQLQVRFDALVGMDVLARMSWQLEKVAHAAQASNRLDDVDGAIWVPLDSLNGPPICTLDDGNRAIIDTGANFSYCIGHLPHSAKEVGEFQDWSLLWGTISSPLWEDTLCVGGLNLPVRFGRLPSKAESALAWMGTGWIVGADLLREFQVTMDFPQGRLGLRPHRGGSQ